VGRALLCHRGGDHGRARGRAAGARAATAARAIPFGPEPWRKEEEKEEEDPRPFIVRLFQSEERAKEKSNELTIQYKKFNKWRLEMLPYVKSDGKIMTKERTLSIIKPDAVAKHHIGDIISRFEKNGLQVVGIKMIRMTPEQAGQFYAVHKGRPFYDDLVKRMSSGPVVVLVLDGDDAVAKNRKLMGATDSKEAEKGTIRADFAVSKGENTVHGSDSNENAAIEIAFFFKPDELTSKK
jgi:nucleoside-diphosphate kinase